MVAPVVVSPDMDSKTASVMDKVIASAKYSGAAPKVPSTVQNAATTRKPSRSRRSLRDRCTGNQMSRPATNVRPKPSTNGSHVGSLNRTAITTGGSIVRLNIMSSSPRILCTTVQFIVWASA